jgi:hypothetical protein
LAVPLAVFFLVALLVAGQDRGFSLLLGASTTLPFHLPYVSTY